MLRRLAGKDYASETARRKIARLLGTSLDVISRTLETVLTEASSFTPIGNAEDGLARLCEYIRRQCGIQSRPTAKACCRRVTISSSRFSG